MSRLIRSHPPLRPRRSKKPHLSTRGTKAIKDAFVEALQEDHRLEDQRIGFLRRAAKRLRQSSIVVGLEAVGLISLIFAAGLFVYDLRERQDERLARTWQLMAIPSSGNSGKREALEYMNSEYGCLRDWISSDLRFLPLEPNWCWKKKVQLVGTNLGRGNKRTAVFLKGADLRNSNFQFADFRNANLREVNFRNAKLDSVNFSNAALDKGNFENAVINRAVFTESSAQLAKLENSKLQFADFTKANLSFVNLQNTVLHGATMSETILWRANLSDAELMEVKITGAMFRGTNLNSATFLGTVASGSDFDQSNFYRTIIWTSGFSANSFKGARFTEASIAWCQFPASKFTRTVFDRTGISSSSFKNSDFSQSVFNAVVINSTDFGKSVFAGTTFRAANLSNLDFSNTDFTGAAALNTTFRESNFSGADFAEFHAGKYSQFTGNWAYANNPPVNMPPEIERQLALRSPGEDWPDFVDRILRDRPELGWDEYTRNLYAN